MENQSFNEKQESSPQDTNSLEQESQLQIDKEKLSEYIEVLKMEQNLPLGMIVGLIAAIVGAILWAVITVSTGYQIGYMAVAVGFLVGFSIKFGGKGIDNIFGIGGAILALVGCLLGNLLSIIGFAAGAEGLGYLEILGMIDYAAIPQIMIETFNPMDILFYGIALYEGYQFSFRNISEEEILEHAAVRTNTAKKI